MQRVTYLDSSCPGVIVIIIRLRYTYFKLEKWAKDDGYEGQR